MKNVVNCSTRDPILIDRKTCLKKVVSGHRLCISGKLNIFRNRNKSSLTSLDLKRLLSHFPWSSKTQESLSNFRKHPRKCHNFDLQFYINLQFKTSFPKLAYRHKIGGHFNSAFDFNVLSCKTLFHKRFSHNKVCEAFFP